MIKKIRWLVAGVVAVMLFSTAQPAFAHSELTHSTPEANAHLNRAPAQVELVFSEAVDPNFSRIEVLNSQGGKADNGDSRVDPANPTRLTVSLRSLPDGVYTVAWKALSAVDGHLTEGSFPFAVGNVDTAALAAAKTGGAAQTPAAPGTVAVRSLLYLGLAALAGGLLFSLLVWEPSLRDAQVSAESELITTYTHTWRTLAAASLGGIGLVSLVGVLVQAGQAAGSGLVWPWSSQAIAILTDSRYGILVIARLAAGLLLAGLLLAPGPRWNRWAAVPIVLGLGLTYALESHAAAQPAPILPVLSDGIHLLAASVWVGGLFLFLAGLWSARRLAPDLRTRLTAILIPHFTNLALTSVAILTLTGVYASLVDIGSLQALVSTPYGQALLVKLAIAMPMIGMGAYNLLVTTPRMRTAAQQAGGDPGRVLAFRRLLTGEAALGVLLLAWVGVFTSLPPAQVTPAPSGFTRSLQSGDLRLELSIDPGKVGVNSFMLQVSSAGQPVTDANEVDLRFTAQSGRVASTDAHLVSMGGGRYMLHGSYLSLADRWQVTAIVRRPQKFDAYASTVIDTGAAAGAGSGGISLTQLAAIFLAATTLAYAFAFFRLIPRRLVWIALGQVPALLLLLASLLVFNQSAQADSNEPVNPVPPSSSSIQAGQVLYQNNCLVCHGPQGKGDGPIGLMLNPRPADLSQHAVPGVHTDGQLFEWISSGFPGSVMPGFSDKIPEQDRWNLVNFIRTLAPKN
ncbi:MAG TPA: copper resistance protein CopC [Anaerolineaceae bacterium]